jgi:hypothetical protein
MGVYPFMFGSIKDFEPVVEQIVKVSHHGQPRFTEAPS